MAEQERKPEERPGGPPQSWRGAIWYIPLMFILLWLWQDLVPQMSVRTIPYSEFKHYLALGEVAQCDIRQDEIVGRIEPKQSPEGSPKGGGSIAVEKNAGPRHSEGKADKEATSEPKKAVSPRPKNGSTNESTKGQAGSKSKSGAFLFRTVRVEDPELVDELVAANVTFEGVRSGFLSTFLFAWVLPIGLMVVLWIFLSRRLRGAGQAALSFGRSKAKLIADKDTGVTFDDVAGCDEAKAELEEVVDFLKTPERYRSLGARIPKGVLLVGPPGTGKTLMARAVAGEAKVPFFSISGSDFVEMFVGVGAARVRDLFTQAKKTAPCIIFIDELDAIGRQRGVHVGPVNDEREQTLNQLLVEMDGFEANVGVILLSATNRPDVLDHALLRPGRFDRQIVVDAPDFSGRERILEVHARGKPLAEDVDLSVIAKVTPGFSGADLANAINEAALLAARRNEGAISQKDLEDAMEKVVAGPERKSRRLDEDDKRRVAYHETGHALVAAYSKYADPVHKITIVPRGRAALGYTMQLPDRDQFLMSRSQLLDQIKELLGGRAAEEIVFNETTTGAENDLDRATALARRMVCFYGMSDKLGLVHYGHRQDGFFLPSQDGSPQRDFSEEIAKEVDGEVKRILDQAHGEAKAILEKHHDKLDLVAEELLKRETLDTEEFEKLLGRRTSGSRASATPKHPLDAAPPGDSPSHGRRVAKRTRHRA